MLIDNIVFLKERYPILYDEIKKAEEKIEKSTILLEDTKSNNKTIRVEKDGRTSYLHSKYNPLREAESIIDKLEEREDIDEDTHVIFYGLGLGYHIEAFVNRYPDVEFSLYEPSLEVFYHFLDSANLKSNTYRKLTSVQCEYKPKIMEDFFNSIIKKIDKKIIIMDLPSYSSVFREKHEMFFSRFKEVIINKRKSLHTNYAFQKRWIINSMKNFKEVLSTPNILAEKKGAFKNKPAILVAAGPSLNDEIENLRYIKENGLAYIFSVGSSINTLIHNGIYPDAVTTYDPTEKNQIVFEMLKEKDIKEVPMIFGSSVGYETLENYPGKKYHMITSQDAISNYYLRNKDSSPINIVYDAPSIAVVTLQLLYQLGFNPIILAGQNLGYRGKLRYSEGISYSSDITDEEIENSIYVEDVYGNEILTNKVFDSMRYSLEAFIKSYPNLSIINTTKGGAKIEGTKFMEFKEVINKELNKKIVETNWLTEDKTLYDLDYLMKKSKGMDKAYDSALKLNREYMGTLDKIDLLINNKNYKQAEKKYRELDDLLRKIENNNFYKVFILPMNRVHYKILADSIDSLNMERDLYQKGKKIVEKFRAFINICIKDIEKIEPIYEEMKKIIETY